MVNMGHKDRYNGLYKDVEDALSKKGTYQTEWLGGAVDFLDFFLRSVRFDKNKDFRFTWEKRDWGGIATVDTFPRKQNQ